MNTAKILIDPSVILKISHGPISTKEYERLHDVSYDVVRMDDEYLISITDTYKEVYSLEHETKLENSHLWNKLLNAINEVTDNDEYDEFVLSINKDHAIGNLEQVFIFSKVCELIYSLIENNFYIIKDDKSSEGIKFNKLNNRR